MRALALLLIAVFTAHGQLALAQQQNMSPGHAGESGNTIIEPPQPVDGFTLVRHTGDRLSDRNLEGRWDMLYFGYTFCPDVCPVTLSTLGSVVRELESAGWADDDWAAWLISVDPERDTPERLGEYVKHFHPAFNGATGRREQLDHLAEQMQVRYEVEAHPPGDRFYVVSHTSTVAIVDPDGALVAVLDDSARPEALADQLDALRDDHQARQATE